MQRRTLMVGTIGVALVGHTAAAQQRWEEIVGSEGRYRLKIPAEVHRIAAAGHGVVMTTYVTVLPGRFAFEFIDVAFGTAHAFPQGTAVPLEQMQAGMQKSFPGSVLVEQRSIVTGSLPGRDFSLSTDGGSRFMRSRVYLMPSAAYTATVQGPAAERENPAVAQFLDSIQFG